MAISQRWTVIGIFNDQDTAKKAMEELLQAEFMPEQVGYVVRDTGQVVSKEAVEIGEETGSFTGGVIGGVVGAAETLLIPVLGPSVANTIPATVEPLAQEMVERFQHTGIDEQQDHILPVTDDGIAEVSLELSTAEDTEDIGNTDEEDPEDTLEMKAIARTPQTIETNEEAEALDPDVDDEDDEDEIVEPEGMQEDEATTANNADISRKREDEATGAVTGGIVGGVVGVAAGLLLPFIAPAIAGGAVIAALGGAALGAVAGGFLGTFVSMGVPEEHARQYEQEFKTGRTIVTVKTNDRQQDALDILLNNGAIYANAHDRA